MDTQMTNAHRMFLQGFMCQGIQSAKDVRQLFKISWEQHPNQTAEDHNLAEFVEVININLKPTNLELRKAVCEDTGAHFYGLVNLAKTSITLMASDYSSNELEIYKRITEAIMDSERGSISSFDVLNMTDAVADRKILKKDIEALLARLERDQWMTVMSGQVSLSTRSLLELEQYLRDQFPDSATNCNMCSHICVKGESCINCDVKLHLHCAGKLFPQGQEAAARKCPGCSEQWPPRQPAARAGRAGRAGGGGGGGRRRAEGTSTDDSSPISTWRRRDFAE